ncbi:MAG: TolC family protein [Bacteroidales bacterium]
MNRFFLVLIISLSSVTVFGQQSLNTSVVPTNIDKFRNYEGVSFFMEDSTQILLPPINFLIENARNSAQVLYYQTQKEADDRELKSIKRKWMESIKLSASYQYGATNSYLMYSESGIIVPPNDKYTSQAQSYYLLGAGISLPLSEIFDRGNRIKKQKIITKEKDYQAQMWHDDQTIKIINCYTFAMENIVMMKQLLEDYTLSSAQYAVSEVDFVKGKLSIQDLNKQKTILARSKSELEKNKMSLIKNILTLEVLSNTKIISGKTKQ